ncbi:MAG: OmpH family outer membrane protein [Spirochaetaceae bacterium]|jgi:Skp family chaperone for outer membrane proteins|nr:OmpH family outer membrane protein [Spirochaetaceae bacterium]
MRTIQKEFFCIAFAALAVFCGSVPLSAQQITRFAVVDYNRVLQSFNVRNNAYSELEKKTEQVKAELEKRQQEIKDMQARIEELQKAISEPEQTQVVDPPNENDLFLEGGAPARQSGTARQSSRSQSARNAQTKAQEAELARLKADILKKTDALKDYYQKKTAELEADRARINANSVNTDIMNQINAQVMLVAESEGYTMVLDKNTKGIVWYSRSVDITDKVIAAVQARRR